jgi:hypothetical protein
MISITSGLRSVALMSAFLLPAPAAAVGTAPAGQLAIGTAPVEQVAIDIVTVEGSGCPAGTVTVSALPDNTGFQLHYTDYRVVASGGALPALTRRNCHVELAVQVPDGFAYAVMRTDYRGGLHVEPDASTALRPTFYFTGKAPLILRLYPFVGPLDGGWQQTENIEPEARVFSSCEELRNLHIHNELRVNAGSSPDQSSWISLSDADAHALVEFEWRRC